MTVTLADFLLARIADDEAAARAITRPEELHPWGDRRLTPVTVAQIPAEVRGYLGGNWGEHFARWDPARVLAECQAKRRIVELHSGREDYYTPDELRALALPYADHPDYQQEWKP